MFRPGRNRWWSPSAASTVHQVNSRLPATDRRASLAGAGGRGSGPGVCSAGEIRHSGEGVESVALCRFVSLFFGWGGGRDGLLGLRFGAVEGGLVAELLVVQLHDRHLLAELLLVRRPGYSGRFQLGVMSPQQRSGREQSSDKPGTLL